MKPDPEEFTVGEELGRRLRDTPYPHSLLADRDGFGLSLVDKRRGRELWKVPPTGYVWVTVVGDEVTAAEVLEGRRAKQAWLDHVVRFEPEDRRRIEQIFAGRPLIDEALESLSTPPSLVVSLTGTRRAGGKEYRLYATRRISPPRWAGFEVRLDEEGRVEGYTILEGEASQAAYQKYIS